MKQNNTNLINWGFNNAQHLDICKSISNNTCTGCSALPTIFDINLDIDTDNNELVISMVNASRDTDITKSPEKGTGKQNDPCLSDFKPPNGYSGLKDNKNGSISIQKLLQKLKDSGYINDKDCPTILPTKCENNSNNNWNLFFIILSIVLFCALLFTFFTNSKKKKKK